MSEQSPVGPRPVRCLSFHSDYACANTGVCCSSGWDIAVEVSAERSLKRRLSADSRRFPNGTDGFEPMADPPPGCQSVLRRSAVTGACWFRDEADGRCAVHREFGEVSLPSACRQFPRVCVLEPDCVALSLTHYCPTAAALLFRPGAGFRVDESPKSFPPAWPYEGLDARSAYSPFLRPGVLLGYDGLRALESEVLMALSAPDIFGAIQRVRWVVNAAHAWTPSAGGLVELIRHSRAGEVVPFVPRDPRAVLNASLPRGTRIDAALPEWDGRVGQIGETVDLALRRYIAARFFGSWITFLADDLMTTAAYLDLCLNTVLLFAGARSADEPELSRWKEAIRSSDLWLMHHCDPDLIARNCGRVSG